jgi:hypothetical protein
MTDRWRLINGKELYDMIADSGQKKDVGSQYAQVVAELRSAYERWYADISKRFDEYCEIIVGAEKENPARLCCHDWHGEVAPSDQAAVRKGVKANGFWAIEVARAGKYEVILRQQPAEARFPIEATLARLTIGATELSKPVPQGATAVAFQVELPSGKTRLQTWFGNTSGDLHGAYYVDMRYLE